MAGSPKCSRRKPLPRAPEPEEVDPTGRYIRFAEVLGRGADKCVFMAFDRVEGKEVAWNQVPVLPEVAARLHAEVSLLSTLDHRNIIKMYASWHDPVRHHINFITELFSSGTLRQYTQKYRSVEMQAIKRWSRQILRGLLYLHSHDPPIIHRDLKCDNIFVNGNRGELKIGDLGLAKILEHKGREAHSVLGTPEYMAPELYDESYTELVDVYAFGMCLLEIITGEYPYCECSNAAQVYKRVSEGKQPQSLNHVTDPQVRHIIELCISPERRRPAVRDLMLLPFLFEDPFKAGVPLNSRGSSTHLTDEEVGRRHSFPLPAAPPAPRFVNPELASQRQTETFMPLVGTSPYSSSQIWSPDSYTNEKPWAGPLAAATAKHHQPSVHPTELADGTQLLGIFNSLTSSLTPGRRTSDSSFTDDDTCHLVPGGREVPQAALVAPVETAPGVVPVVSADRGFKIRGKVTSDTEIKLRLRIEDEDGNVQTVRFLFDLSQDTPLAVATEMIDELALTDRDVSTISDKLAAEINRLVPTWVDPTEGLMQEEAEEKAGVDAVMEEVHQMDLDIPVAQALLARNSAAALPAPSFGTGSHLSASFSSNDGVDPTSSPLSAQSTELRGQSELMHPAAAAAAAAVAAFTREVDASKGSNLLQTEKQRSPSSVNHRSDSMLQQLRKLGGSKNSGCPADTSAAPMLPKGVPQKSTDAGKEDLYSTDLDKKVRYALPKRSGSITNSGRRIISRTSTRAFPSLNNLQANRCMSEQTPGGEVSRFLPPPGLPKSPTEVLQRHDHVFHAAIPGHRAHMHSFRMPVQRSISTTQDTSLPDGTPPKATAFWSGEMKLVSNLGDDEELATQSSVTSGSLDAVEESPEKEGRTKPVGTVIKSFTPRGLSLLQREIQTQQQVEGEASADTADLQDRDLKKDHSALVGSIAAKASVHTLGDATEVLSKQERVEEDANCKAGVEDATVSAPKIGENMGINGLSPKTRARAVAVAIKRNSSPLENHKMSVGSLGKRSSGTDRRGWGGGGGSSVERIKLGGMDTDEAERASYVELKVTWVQAHEEKSVSVGAPGVDLKRLLHLEGAPHLVREGSYGHVVSTHAAAAPNFLGKTSKDGAANVVATTVSDAEKSLTVPGKAVKEPLQDFESHFESSVNGSMEDADIEETEEQELNVMEEALTELLQQFAIAPAADS